MAQLPHRARVAWPALSAEALLPTMFQVRALGSLDEREGPAFRPSRGHFVGPQ